MTLLRADEARLAALAIQETRRREDKLVQIDELIKAEVRKGRLKALVAELPLWIQEELIAAGYTVHHLHDGYEIRWDTTEDGGRDGLIRP